MRDCCVRVVLAAWALAAAGAAGAAERPHIIVILVDDLGFADVGYHGSEIATPHLDTLARGGVRFSQFHNSGRCCPTRASLMTGLHPHQTGIGWMTEPAGSQRGQTEPPAYRGQLNRQCVTIAEVLQQHGYATMMTGKWHLGYNDRDCWPLQRGFEQFYGCIEGAMNFFQPQAPRGIVIGNREIDQPESTTDRAFYTTDAFTDHAIRFLEQERRDRGRPSFLYLAYNAPHWPLQAHEEDIDRYRGRYRMGWEQLRRERYRRQIELGLIHPDWQLSPPTEGIPPWDWLDEAKQDEMDLKMAVYAAMVDRVDQNIGKLVAYLKQSGLYDQTLILFFSDNGACEEGGVLGRGEFHDIEKRNQQIDNAYGEAWANAGNTPLRQYKRFAHEGGTATPFFMHWPARISPQGPWYEDPAHVLDLMPTILDVAGADYPEASATGQKLPPLEGISLRPAFDGRTLRRAEPIFHEHEMHASMRDGDWKLVGQRVAMIDGTDRTQWELYHLGRDRTEMHDLAAEEPERVQRMAQRWQQWAERVGVYPRGQSSPPPPGPRPDPWPPQVVGRPFSIQATVSHPAPHGVVLAHGGNRFGYAVYFDRGRPAFAVRNEGRLAEVIGETPVSGQIALTARLDPHAMVIEVDGVQVAKGPSPGLLKGQPGIGLYRGLDHSHAVGSYEAPFPFNGTIERAEVRGQAIGSCRSNRIPAGSRFSTSSLPPIAVTSRSATAGARPRSPPGVIDSLIAKTSKNLGSDSGGMRRPVAAMVSSTVCSCATTLHCTGWSESENFTAVSNSDRSARTIKSGRPRIVCETSGTLGMGTRRV